MGMCLLVGVNSKAESKSAATTKTKAKATIPERRDARYKVKRGKPARRRRNEIALAGHLLSRMPRPRSSIEKCSAGGTTSVVYSPSTIAGPSTVFPGRSDSYVKIGVGRKSFSGGQ